MKIKTFREFNTMGNIRGGAYKFRKVVYKNSNLKTEQDSSVDVHG